MYATTNPYTGEVVKKFPEATNVEVIQAIEKAHAAFLSWRDTPFTDRAKVRKKAANILRKDSDEYAKLLTLEMGKLVSEAKAEVELSARIFEYYAVNARTLLAPEKLPVAAISEGEAAIVRDPLGVLLAVEPWNLPNYQVARIIAPQLSAGNAILLKHAGIVSQSAAPLRSSCSKLACRRAPSKISMQRIRRSSSSSTIRSCVALR